MISTTIRTIKTDPISIGQLTERMRTEQEQYRQRIMDGSPKERLRYAHELTIRDNIIKYMDTAQLYEQEVLELLCLKSPLAIIFMRFDFYYNECQMPYYEGIDAAISDGVELVLAMKEKREVGADAYRGLYRQASPKRLLL